MAVGRTARQARAFLPPPGAQRFRSSGPTPGTHVAGELYVDKDGTLWFTRAGAHNGGAYRPVRFVKLAGTTGSGAFHSIAPQRAYDSRHRARTRRTDRWRRTRRVS